MASLPAGAGARPFRTLRGEGAIALAIKRSRFLGRAVPLRHEQEVVDWLLAVRAAHPDAAHHCFAYRLGVAGEMGRFSDDGEPGGTAGRPIMEVLLRAELVDVAVVVTRYFGGVLLGAGGLVRAYSQAATEAVGAAGVVGMRPHTEMAVTVDYAALGGLEQFVRHAGLLVLAKDFTARVTVRLAVPAGEEDAFAVRVADLTAGTGSAVPERTLYLPDS